MSRCRHRALLAGWMFTLLSFASIAHAELVAHFPFDGDAVDVKGSREGTVGEGVNILDAGGKFGGTADFEGFGGILLEYEEALNPESAFTVTAWVNPTDTTDWNSVITSRSHLDDTISGFVIYNTPENQWDFWTGGGGAPGTWGRAVGPQAVLNTWQHLAITYDGNTDTKTLYVNGRRRAFISGQGYMPNPNNPLSIGSGGDLGTEFFFKGMIDDVSIWNEALSLDSIQRIMNNGVAAFTHAAPGDFNGDGQLTTADIDDLSQKIRGGTNPTTYDLTKDGKVDFADHTYWIESLKKTWYGDANMNGEFNSADFVVVFQAGEYEDAIAGKSTWATGDWNGDGEFNSSDFVTAFQGGGFEQGPRTPAAIANVPEPASMVSALTASALAFILSRRGSQLKRSTTGRAR